MSFSDLHNPKAAAELLAKYKKAFNSRTCHSPFDDHNGKIISAHTLSVSSMLKAISRKGHVYSQDLKNIFSPNPPIAELKLLGLREVSTFNGFCSKHDAKLFSCLENKPFRFEQEQLFMLAFRSISKEFYLKGCEIESLPSPEEIAKIHGIEGDIVHTDELNQYILESLQGFIDVGKIKDTFDRHLLNFSWSRLVSKAIIFPNQAPITSSFSFAPVYCLNGVQLQNFSDFNTELSGMIFSIIPLEKGSAAIFSWLDTSNSAPKKYFDSILESKNMTAAILHVVLDNGENFALSPDWYDSLSDSQKNYIQSRMRIGVRDPDTTPISRSRVDETSPYLDYWGDANIAEF